VVPHRRPGVREPGQLAGVHVEVDPVLHRLRFGNLVDPHRPGRRVAPQDDVDLTGELLQPEPEHPGPEGAEAAGVGDVDHEVFERGERHRPGKFFFAATGATENQTLIAEAFAAWEHGDYEPFFKVVADDVRWTVIGSTPISGTFEGKQA